ncbi:MAG: TonB-dependent receptor [Woeseiaceae bacterium]|nr:TonB-dependent receptor [Woeseiaceae bacterium]NIP21041.1 TonB-dependent receptor [Woeseiaceae bacterium]NIS90013.1 TonB-dependent receptor [Woeseiaceae bacterium]
MPFLFRLPAVLAVTACIAMPPAALAAESIEELVVTSQRREQPRLLHAGNVERLDAELLEAVKHHHMHELLTRVSGAWLSRGSGQEHLTAIRSPVLTGAGSCGAFLFLEDGIPIRPAGFCNVNSLFEINTEQAHSVEVIRGPGNALYGSNALHGTVNVLMPGPGARGPGAALEVGENDFYRARVEVPFDPDSNWLAALVYADDGGFRDDSGYTQGKLHAKGAWELDSGSFTLGLTATDLDQETAGFILGEDAYRDPDVNRSNPNPEAFRKASAERVYGIWTSAHDRFDLDLRPYLRHSDMEFLQHFLPGQPLEENGHVSGGVLATLAFGDEQLRTTVGMDVEYADIFLEETQDGPTQGSPFLMETRPEGKHYDYDVAASSIAAYVQTDWAVNDELVIAAGLRLDYLNYDYNNRMLDGNTRDDGTPCGFGGCLYTRPADRSDSFTNLAPKLALNHTLGDTGSFYISLSRGFRAPQATELYRLQSGQQVADLDSERVDAFDIGVREIRDDLSVDLALFHMRKRDSVYRDADGFNVTGARSKHRGIELALDWQFAEAWSVALNATYARHQYDFDVVASRGETFESGRDVDTAPRWLGSLELQYAPNDRFDVALQWASIGKYYLDAENRFDYPGHTIANLRAGARVSATIDVVLRLNNVTDRDIADRADYAFGNYRYFPGRGRELFAEIRYTPSESL